MLSRSAFAVAAALVLGGCYGFAAGVYKLFPYNQVQAARDRLLGPGPIATTPRVSLFQAVRLDADVVMIGDSLTEAGLWSEFFPDRTIANRGVAGDTTAAILRRFDTIAATTPETAFLMAGINDIRAGLDPPLIADTIARIIDRLDGMGVRVVLQLTVECRQLHCGAQLDAVRALNLLLQDRTWPESVAVLDPNRVLSGPDGLRAKHTYDGIHLTGPGYRAWADLIQAEGLL